MSANFPRTMRSLKSSGRLESRGFLAAAVVLLLIWCVWFVAARVAVHELSDAARLEVTAAVVPVQTDAAGLVVRQNLRVGDNVRQGDVLVELDAESDRRALVEERTHAAGLTSEIAVLQRQLASEEQSLQEIAAAAEVANVEARQRHELARINAAFSREELEWLEELRRRGSASELELLRAHAATDAAAKSEEIAEVTVRRVEREQQERLEKQRALLEALRKDRARLTSELEQAQAAVSRLEHAVERRLVRAPGDGRIGESTDLPPGSFVQPGDTIARIIPPGALRVVAFFPPATALGRIAPGQPARVRLYGFPWGQYGSLPATVTAVAEEPRDGRVRVECRLHPDRDTPIPLRHGLPGAVEVEVERLSPAALVLRLVGRSPPPVPAMVTGNN